MTKLMKSSDSYKTYVAKEGKRFSDAVVVRRRQEVVQIRRQKVVQTSFQGV